MTGKGHLVYEGKAKKVFAADVPDLYIVEYKDDATAFNGEKRGQIRGKGCINNQMSNLLFAILEQHGVPTHFVKELSEVETLVKSWTSSRSKSLCETLPPGAWPSGSVWSKARPLQRPIVEFYYKDDALGDPMVTDDHITVLGWASQGDLAVVRRLALRVNDVLQDFFRTRGVILVDFKLEFGRLPDGKIVLADEISPDTCRFWDANTQEKLDKDRFRRDLGGVEEAYQEIFRRVTEEVRV